MAFIIGADVWTEDFESWVSFTIGADVWSEDFESWVPFTIGSDVWSEDFETWDAESVCTPGAPLRASCLKVWMDQWAARWPGDFSTVEEQDFFNIIDRQLSTLFPEITLSDKQAFSLEMAEIVQRHVGGRLPGFFWSRSVTAIMPP